MSKYDATLTIFGDTLRVTWTGSVWESPSTHRQHSNLRDAMKEELEQYLLESGDDPEEMQDEIENWLDKIVR